MCCGTFSSIPDLSSLNAKALSPPGVTKRSPDAAKCPLGESATAERHRAHPAQRSSRYTDSGCCGRVRKGLESPPSPPRPSQVTETFCWSSQGRVFSPEEMKSRSNGSFSIPLPRCGHRLIRSPAKWGQRAASLACPQSCLQRAGPTMARTYQLCFGNVENEAQRVCRTCQGHPAGERLGSGEVFLGLFIAQGIMWGCLPSVEQQEGTRCSTLLGVGPLTSRQGDRRPTWQPLCVWPTHSGSFEGHQGLSQGQSGVCAMGAAPRRVPRSAQHSSPDTMPGGPHLQGEPRSDLGSVPGSVGPLPSYVPSRHSKRSPSPALMPTTGFQGIPKIGEGRHRGDQLTRTLS